MAASDAIVHTALAMGFGLAGPLLRLAGPQGVYAIGGAAAAVAALLFVPMVRSGRASAAVGEETAPAAGSVAGTLPPAP
jgi:hypothetical protein